MEQQRKTEPLTILVIDHDGGELLSYARSEFDDDHVLNVDNPVDAKRAVGQIAIDVILCGESQREYMWEDPRLTVVRHPSDEQRLGLVPDAQTRRIRRQRAPTEPLPLRSDGPLP